VTAVPAGGAHETRWPAPAKLNLFLHIVGRRPDGYHELQTLFQLIDLCDTVSVVVRNDGLIERPIGPIDVAPEADLVVRAARALQARTGVSLGATLRVFKKIPQGGGLGGGSSDAATTLLALNRLWGCGLSLDELAGIGLPLGADVPVFVRGSSAWAEGVGERLTPVQLPERWFVVVHPGVGVATREVFQAPELTRNSPVSTIRAFLEAGGAGGSGVAGERVVAGGASAGESGASGVAGGRALAGGASAGRAVAGGATMGAPFGRNDCEPVVRARYAEVADALEWLSRYAPARLTGTGACIFAACASEIDAERLAARVPDRWKSYVARGLNVSPVHERL
jgi:4-diphosphocytidyl-2-C-methyl-D-erythritol kinase